MTLNKRGMKKRGNKMADETVYINKCSIKEKKFDNGGSVLNIAVHVDELNTHKNEDGWINITVCKRREVSDKGHTHYAKLNTYVPKADTTETTETTETTATDDDLPF